MDRKVSCIESRFKVEHIQDQNYCKLAISSAMCKNQFQQLCQNALKARISIPGHRIRDYSTQYTASYLSGLTLTSPCPHINDNDQTFTNPVMTDTVSAWTKIIYSNNGHRNHFTALLVVVILELYYVQARNETAIYTLSLKVRPTQYTATVQCAYYTIDNGWQLSTAYNTFDSTEVVILFHCNVS